MHGRSTPDKIPPDRGGKRTTLALLAMLSCLSTFVYATLSLVTAADTCLSASSLSSVFALSGTPLPPETQPGVSWVVSSPGRLVHVYYRLRHRVPVEDGVSLCVDSSLYLHTWKMWALHNV